MANNTGMADRSLRTIEKNNFAATDSDNNICFNDQGSAGRALDNAG